MRDIDYVKWADYIERIFKRFECAPNLIADLACGTGSFCIEMDKRGYEMIGIDLSPDMLACASEKAHAAEADVLWLNQDMTDFELYGTVDAVVCLLDSVNNITKPERLLKMLELVRNYLNPGGLFIFDVNTPHKLENVLGNNVFYSVDDDVVYIWQCSFDAKTTVSKFDLTFFTREGKLYDRFDEVHFERAYESGEFQSLITESGLELLDRYEEMSFKKPEPCSERTFYVCRRPQ